MREEIIRKHADEAVVWRHWLHAHPEISTKEKESSAYIKAVLEDMGLTVQTFKENYGLTAVIEGTGEGKCLGLRADFDALPVNEETGLDFASVNEGVMHACGHDMHASVLLGTAAALCDMRQEFKGKVKLIFQPAEEVSCGKGAVSMIEEGCLNNPKVDAVIAEHMWPELHAGEIGIKKGALTSATDRFVITVFGKSAHGGKSPHKGVDAIVIASQIVTSLQCITSRNMSPFDNFVLSIGKIEGGTAYNIIADKVTLTGTMRTVDETVRKLGKKRIEEICKGIASSMGGSSSVEYDGSYDVTVNDDELCEILKKAADSLEGIAKPVDIGIPSMIGEDFSLYGQKVPACLYLFGTKMRDSDTSTLHQSTYAPSDKLIETGINMMTKTVLEYLNA